MTMNRESPNTEEERSLLAAARAGDEPAFGRFASRYRPALDFFCLLMLGCPHAAQDAVCETLLRGWRDLARGAPAESPRIWLYRRMSAWKISIGPMSLEAGDRLTL